MPLAISVSDYLLPAPAWLTPGHPANQLSTAYQLAILPPHWRTDPQDVRTEFGQRGCGNIGDGEAGGLRAGVGNISSIVKVEATYSSPVTAGLSR
ncbi:hypothetical protein ACMYSN_23965 [Klebsiella sp. R445]